MSKQTERTSEQLKDMMWSELEALTDGSSTPQNARAKASLGNLLCSIARLEMDFSRFVSDARTSTHRALGSIPMGELNKK